MARYWIMRRIRGRCTKMTISLRHTVCLALLAQGFLSCTGANVSVQSDNLSTGVYRIPYEDKTQVVIRQDHTTHKPPNRLDLVGLGSNGQPHRLVAAASGVVRYIVDEFTIRQDRNAPQCNNNYVWIEHPNGEWTKYSHMQQNSVRRSAQLKVGDTVQAGTYLGDEGEVGCATGRHLHFEVAVPRDPADPIVPTGGFIKGQNRIPRICDIPGQTASKDKRYTAAPCLNGR